MASKLLDKLRKPKDREDQIRQDSDTFQSQYAPDDTSPEEEGLIEDDFIPNKDKEMADQGWLSGAVPPPPTGGIPFLRRMGPTSAAGAEQKALVRSLQAELEEMQKAGRPLRELQDKMKQIRETRSSIWSK